LRGWVSISLAWFFFMGGLGLFMPFYSLFLHENLALSGLQVGLVLAIQPMVGMLAQPLWGNVADRSGSRASVLVALCLGSAVGYLAISGASGFVGVALATALTACFAPPLMPNATAVTLAVTQGLGRSAFGLSRMCGTLGFFVLVVSCPWLIDWIERIRGIEPLAGGPSEPALGNMFVLAAALYAFAALIGLSLPRGGAVSLQAQRGDWRALLRHGPYVRFLVFAFFAFLMVQGPMGFFPVYIRAQDGSLATVSQLWIPMLLLEFPLVALSGVLVERIGARGLLGMGMLAAGTRWTICGFFPPEHGTWFIYAVQLLHGVTVGGLIIGGPLYVEAVTPEHLRNTGQALLATLGVALGGIASNALTGLLVQRVSTNAPYIAGGIGGLLLVVTLPWLVPTPTRPRPAT
jgi:PPP family 3-phenylpropionic acid transporter